MAKDAEIKRFTVKVSYREKSESWAFRVSNTFKGSKVHSMSLKKYF